MALKTYIIFLCLLVTVYTSYIKQSNSDKEQLEIYIEGKKAEINQRYRLHYHVAGPVGWINDPNGFSFYKGEYHLFYQFYPYDSVWGPMHWGHVTSKDLVNWKQLPTALLPEQEQCFSGSAVVDGDDMILIYTGHEITDTEPYFNQTQYLAFSSDGVEFEKYKGNPVIPTAPNGSPDFRDPKAWRHGDYWYVVIGSKTLDDRGRVLLYRSEDLFSWEFLTVLAESDGSLGYMWECPDFFELDGKYVLLMSPQGIEEQGDRYKNIFQTGYIIGNFNYDNYKFVPEVEFQELDFGHDFYAAQTTEMDDKRYLVGWFNMWEKIHLEAVDGWAGAMTIVRELRLSNNRLLMMPVPEMISLRDNLVYKGRFERYQEESFDKTAEIIIEGNLDNDIKLVIYGSGRGGRVDLRWDSVAQKVIFESAGAGVRQVEWNPISSKSWRIFLDASSMELFCGEGEVVFSTRVFPVGGWNIVNVGPEPLNIEAYTLKRSVEV